VTAAQKTPQSFELIDAALAWAKKGVPVFPTGEDKRPLTKNGFYDASSDPEVIKTMFNAAGTRLHGIGGRMGKASGLFAIDADTYKIGAAGEAARNYIQGLAATGLLPNTRVHATRNGGRHYIFSSDTEFPNCKPSKGVEVKGEGGYIVLPPSPGYSVEHEAVAQAPRQLLDSLKEARVAQTATSIDALKRNILSGEDFHDSITQLAAKLSAAGEPMEMVQKKLLDVLNASVAANQQHPRHHRWHDIVTNRDGELSRIVTSGHVKFNSTAKTDAVRDAMSEVFAHPLQHNPFDNPLSSGFDHSKKDEETRGAFRFSMVGEMQVREPQFLIANILEENALIQIFGEPGVGKSLIAYDMAACIVSGQPFHGRDVKQGSVIILAGEGHNGIKRRFAAWEKRREHSLDGLPLHVSQQPAQLLDPTSVGSMISAIDSLIAEHGAPTLLVVDTLARNFGPGDENSNRDMSNFVGVLDKIRSRYECSVMVVHHSGHGDAGRGRGASALKAAVDAEFAVKREGELSLVLSCTKMKDAPKLSNIFFAIDLVEVGQTSDGTIVTGPVLTKTAIVAKHSRRTLFSPNEQWVADAIYALTKDGNAATNIPVLRDDLKRKCYDTLTDVKPDAKRQRFTRALDKLLEGGAIVAVDGGFVLSPEFRRPDDAAFSTLKRNLQS